MDRSELQVRCYTVIDQINKFIFANKVQLQGLQTHCKIFLPGYSWAIDCRLADTEAAIIALERRFLRDPVTHMVIRKFLKDSQMRIYQLPQNYFSAKMVASLVPSINPKTDIHLKFHFDYDDASNNLMTTTVVISADCSRAWLCDANNKKHYNAQRVHADLRRIAQENLFSHPTMVSFERHFAFFDITAPRGRKTHFTKDEMETALRIIGEQEKTCACCGKQAKRVCLNCHMTRFCTTECQHRAWREHQKFCSFIETLADGLSKIANGCKIVPFE